MPFSFKVKKKYGHYSPGVVVIGKVLSGTISNDDNVLVKVGNNTYTARVDAICSRYPSGVNVVSCDSGNNVALYLSGISNDVIIPQTTMIQDVTYKESLMTKIDEFVEGIRGGKDCQPLKPDIPPSQLKVKGIKKKEHKIKPKISKLTSKAKNEYTSAEKEFIQDIQTCLKDKGRIAPTEMFVLEKIRITLNISESRGRELLASVTNKYNAIKNEAIYKEAVSACLLDSGYLTAVESTLLERLRIVLNIPEDRAYEIEKQSDWNV